MQFGHIHSNKKEQALAMLILKMAQEPAALDELGIGRIRDAFSDKMFPGTSTQQKHLKYFTLLPQIYKKATTKRYNSPSEVKGEVVRLEYRMTKCLLKGSPQDTGITGSRSIKKGLNSYVKNDPAYIYNTGLQTFGIMRCSSPYGPIYDTSKASHNAPKALRSDDEDTADDDAEKSGRTQFCSFPTDVEYDFMESCSLYLTTADREFILSHIQTADALQGTLLLYLINHPEIDIPDEFDDLGACPLPKDLAELQDQARRFSDFMCMVYARYNYIRSDYEDESQGEEFEYWLQKFRESGTDIDTVLATVDLEVRDRGCKTFCRRVVECVATGATDAYCELDSLIISREAQVKGARRKIDNPAAPAYDSRKPTGTKLTYRWATVKQYLKELRKEAAHD